jgi:hypothetical protein
VLVYDEYENFRSLFKEIVNGYSFSEKTSWYIKHFSELDNSFFAEKKSAYIKLKNSEGVPTESEKLKILAEQGVWLPEKEEKILELKYLISDNSKVVANMPLLEQRKVIEKVITEKKQELNSLLMERYSALNPTADILAQKYLLSLFVFHGFYKDEQLKIKAFSSDEFDAVEESELDNLIEEQNRAFSKFSETSLGSLAALPFVINQISFCKDRPYEFFGKPIIAFSDYQLNLFSKTVRNIRIIENSENNPPDIHEDTTVKELVDWYDTEHSIYQNKNKNNQPDGIYKKTNYVTR